MWNPSYRNLFLLCLFVGSSIGVSGCFLGAPSGNIVTLKKNFTDFRTLTISKGFKVSVTQGNDYSVSIEIDDNLEELLQVNQFGKDLSIRLKSTPVVNPTLRATITMPILEGVELADASELVVAKEFEVKTDVSIVAYGASRVEWNLKAKNVTVKLSSSSTVQGTWQIENLNAQLTDNSKLEVSGTANNFVLNAIGSILSLSSLTGKNCTFALSQGSQATVNVSEKLEGQLSEASSLFYVGHPRLGEIKKCEGCVVQAK